MSKSPSSILCVTNRSLCKEDFLTQIERLAACQPRAILLREKDLTSEQYRDLAKQVLDICNCHGTLCILHSFVDVAMELGHHALHLPLPILRRMTIEERQHFSILGASCHSVEDAREAEALGCTYITAGHIFDTDCKKGLPGRGLDFLRQVTQAVSIPVYAIGGIAPENMGLVGDCGAAGACIMSSAMNCEDPVGYLAAFTQRECH